MMPVANAPLRGGCHCGRVGIVFETAQAPSTLQPRACDCDFCRKHHAAWVSDADGRIRVEAKDAADVRTLRQGSETARFLLCTHCGVLVAVVFETQGERFGAVNAGCFGEASVFAAQVVASPQRLSPAEKVERWRMLWAHDVVVPPER
jgi:hypothetical protein